MQALQNPRNAAGGRAGSSGLALPHQQQQHRVVMISGSSSRHSRSRVVCPANAPLEGPAIPVSKADLIEHIRSGCKPRDRWRIGTEHEKLGFRLGDRRRMDYAEVRQVFDKLESRFGWKPIKEGDLTIGAALDGQTVTLEPGGQFELSGAPVATLHQTCAEVNSHLYQVKSIAEELGIGFLGAGFDPKWAIDEIPVMPKDRYRLMKAYMPTVGTRGLDMMFRTCTIQVNLDYESEADMVEKFKIGLALQPVAVALFANSPFKEGRPTGELSTRARVWMDVDKARTGGLPFVFEPGMSFERYVDYAMDVPMYFVYRKGKYIDALGQSWRDFMEVRAPRGRCCCFGARGFFVVGVVMMMICARARAGGSRTSSGRRQRAAAAAVPLMYYSDCEQRHRRPARRRRLCAFRGRGCPTTPNPQHARARALTTTQRPPPLKHDPNDKPTNRASSPRCPASARRSRTGRTT